MCTASGCVASDVLDGIAPAPRSPSTCDIWPLFFVGPSNRPGPGASSSSACTQHMRSARGLQREKQDRNHPDSREQFQVPAIFRDRFSVSPGISRIPIFVLVSCCTSCRNRMIWLRSWQHAGRLIRLVSARRMVSAETKPKPALGLARSAALCPGRRAN